MLTKPRLKRVSRRAPRRRQIVLTEKRLEILKEAIKAMQLETERLNDIRRVDPNTLVQPMTL
jgi:hypothetical protein